MSCKATPSTLRRREPRPSVFVEVLPHGKLRIYGTSAAARWLGVTQQSFDRVVRRHYTFIARRPKTIHKPVAARIKEAYPELFKENN